MAKKSMIVKQQKELLSPRFSVDNYSQNTIKRVLITCDNWIRKNEN